MDVLKVYRDQDFFLFFFAIELQMREKRLGAGLPRVTLRVFLKNTDMRGDRVKLPLSVSVGSALPSNTQLCLFAVN